MTKLPGLVCLLAATLAAQKSGPAPFTRKSITQGKQMFLIHCVNCHDEDGRGLNRRDFNSTAPADLTDPENYLHGVSPDAIFASVRNGTKEDMPAFQGKLSDDQIWNIVNFVRNLWPEEKRPKDES
jgi:alcohol dehydrogenase (quinone), cytochrome c subunit